MPYTPPEAVAFLGPQIELMERYVEHLCDTGVSHGLVGPREVPRMWERHVLNCAVVHPGIAQGSRVADIGAGAGLPGLVIAIARPDLEMTLVEPLLRRTTWLERVVDDLELDNVRIERARAEELWGKRQFDVVTSRAVARLGELARWSLPLAGKDGEMFVLKGSRAQQELDEDAGVLRKLKVTDALLESWGADVVEPETLTVRLRAAGGAPQLSRKQAGSAPTASQKKAAKAQKARRRGDDRNASGSGK